MSLHKSLEGSLKGMEYNLLMSKLVKLARHNLENHDNLSLLEKGQTDLIIEFLEKQRDLHKKIVGV